MDAIIQACTSTLAHSFGILLSEVVTPAPFLCLVVGQRPGAVQELSSGHIGALAAGGGRDRLRGRKLGHGQERGSQEGKEQTARPRGG